MGGVKSTSRLNAEAFGLLEKLEPTQHEFQERQQVRIKVETILRKRWNSCHVLAYGSSENGFGFGTSDVDMCLFLHEWDCMDLSPQELLHQVKGQLERSFTITHFIVGARIPILKLKDTVTNISCDISINNPLALRNTALLKLYSQADPRVRPLVYVLKYWAKQRELNDPANGTLSSYAYVLMALHFLQTRKFPILPSVEFNQDDLVSKWDCHPTYGCDRTESVGSLLVQLFHYYAHEFDYTKYVVSINAKKLLQKSEKWNRVVPWRFSIEDPCEPNHDVAKVIFSKRGQALLIEEFQRASKLLLENNSLQLVCSSKTNLVKKQFTCYLCQGYGHTPRKCHSFPLHSTIMKSTKSSHYKTCTFTTNDDHATSTIANVTHLANSAINVTNSPNVTSTATTTTLATTTTTLATITTTFATTTTTLATTTNLANATPASTPAKSKTTTTKLNPSTSTITTREMVVDRVSCQQKQLFQSKNEPPLLQKDQPTQQRNNNNNAPQCWHCGERGHMKAGCPLGNRKGAKDCTNAKTSDSIVSSTGMMKHSSLPNFNDFVNPIVPKVRCK